MQDEIIVAAGKIAEMAPAGNNETLLREMSEKFSHTAVAVLQSYAAMAHTGGEEVARVSAEISKVNLFELFMTAKNSMIHVTEILNSL